MGGRGYTLVDERRMRRAFLIGGSGIGFLFWATGILLVRLEVSRNYGFSFFRMYVWAVYNALAGKRSFSDLQGETTWNL